MTSSKGKMKNKKNSLAGNEITIEILGEKRRSTLYVYVPLVFRSEYIYSHLSCNQIKMPTYHVFVNVVESSIHFVITVMNEQVTFSKETTETEIKRKISVLENK